MSSCAAGDCSCHMMLVATWPMTVVMVMLLVVGVLVADDGDAGPGACCGAGGFWSDGGGGGRRFHPLGQLLHHLVSRSSASLLLLSPGNQFRHQRILFTTKSPPILSTTLVMISTKNTLLHQQIPTSNYLMRHVASAVTVCIHTGCFF